MSYSNKTHVIRLHGEVATSRLSLVMDDFCDPSSKLVFFKDNDDEHKRGECYPYSKANIDILEHPKVFNPQQYSFTYKGIVLDNIYVACKFQKSALEYWTIGFLDSRADLICKGEELVVRRKASIPKNNSVIDYLTAMAYFHGYELRSNKNPEPLGSQYRMLEEQKEAPLFDAYINPATFPLTKEPLSRIPVFPFGLNKTQLQAVRNALSNRISVIQGPPGTGKTQTILNILANLVIQGKTALVVAGSNSATDNVYDKLLSYGLGFIVARLGCDDNKTLFINKQNNEKLCPAEWDKATDLQAIELLTKELEPLFEKNAKKFRSIQEGKNGTARHLEDELHAADFQGKSKKLFSLSMDFFKQALFGRYQKGRNKYTKKDLFDEKQSRMFLRDYPIVLSTAFSAKKNIHPDVLFDYVILDEASQIDVTTGTLALSCARNAVVVGDLKQLPNVIPDDVRRVTDEIFKFYNIPERFNYSANSFLQSICKAFPQVPETTLLEHYRCHPKIAAFFNKEFYDSKLVIMTEDKGEENVLILRHTVPGNHAMDRRNHREEEEIEDIKSDYNITGQNGEEVGIIAPYNSQVIRIDSDEDIEDEILVSTVHKFQGREKDTIIISTVDNQYSDFVNDPHLLNVAVSRAKNRLIIVTNSNEGNSGHMKNLVDYMTENGKVEEGEVRSLFDLIYEVNEEPRRAFLESHESIPADKYAPDDKPSIAEEIAHGFIKDVLKEFPGLSVEYEAVLDDHIPECGYSQMSEEEKDYVAQPGTHIDFLISKTISDGTSVPILAIEIDGETTHIPGTIRYNKKDRMKDRILEEICGIRIERLRTKESINEEERLRGMIKEVI